MALFNTGKKNKKFYEGRKPNYDDVQIIVEKIEHVLNNSGAEVEEQSRYQMKEITRLILQKAIVNNTSQNDTILSPKK